MHSMGEIQRLTAPSQIVRLLGILLLSGIMVWLALDRPSAAVRIDKINHYLESGAIGGGMTPKEESELLQTLRWLAATAGIKEPVLLNQPLPSGARDRKALIASTPPRIDT